MTYGHKSVRTKDERGHRSSRLRNRPAQRLLAISHIVVPFHNGRRREPVWRRTKSRRFRSKKPSTVSVYYKSPWPSVAVVVVVGQTA